MIDLPELEEIARNEMDAFIKDGLIEKVVSVGEPASEKSRRLKLVESTA
jgi:hypothetical protein